MLGRAFDASEPNVPFPDFRAGPTAQLKRLVEIAGVKSYSQYVRGTCSVGATLDPEQNKVQIVPMRNGGARDGFDELTALKIDLEWTATDHQLGEAVAAALDLTT